MKRHIGRQRHIWKENIKMILKEKTRRRGLDSTGSEYRTAAESCAHCNKPLDFIIDQEFLDKQGDCHLSMRIRSFIKDVQDKCRSFCF